MIREPAVLLLLYYSLAKTLLTSDYQRERKGYWQVKLSQRNTHQTNEGKWQINKLPASGFSTMQKTYRPPFYCFNFQSKWPMLLNCQCQKKQETLHKSLQHYNIKSISILFVYTSILPILKPTSYSCGILTKDVPKIVTDTTNNPNST